MEKQKQTNLKDEEQTSMISDISVYDNDEDEENCVKFQLKNNKEEENKRESTSSNSVEFENLIQKQNQLFRESHQVNNTNDIINDNFFLDLVGNNNELDNYKNIVQKDDTAITTLDELNELLYNNKSISMNKENQSMFTLNSQKNQRTSAFQIQPYNEERKKDNKILDMDLSRRNTGHTNTQVLSMFANTNYTANPSPNVSNLTELYPSSKKTDNIGNNSNYTSSKFFNNLQTTNTFEKNKFSKFQTNSELFKCNETDNQIIPNSRRASAEQQTNYYVNINKSINESNSNINEYSLIKGSNEVNYSNNLKEYSKVNNIETDNQENKRMKNKIGISQKLKAIKENPLEHKESTSYIDNSLALNRLNSSNLNYSHNYNVIVVNNSSKRNSNGSVKSENNNENNEKNDNNNNNNNDDNNRDFPYHMTNEIRGDNEKVSNDEINVENKEFETEEEKNSCSNNGSHSNSDKKINQKRKRYEHVSYNQAKTSKSNIQIIDHHDDVDENNKNNTNSKVLHYSSFSNIENTKKQQNLNYNSNNSINLDNNLSSSNNNSNKNSNNFNSTGNKYLIENEFYLNKDTVNQKTNNKKTRDNQESNLSSGKMVPPQEIKSNTNTNVNVNSTKNIKNTPNISNLNTLSVDINNSHQRNIKNNNTAKNLTNKVSSNNITHNTNNTNNTNNISNNTNNNISDNAGSGKNNKNTTEVGINNQLNNPYLNNNINNNNNNNIAPQQNNAINTNTNTNTINNMNFMNNTQQNPLMTHSQNPLYYPQYHNNNQINNLNYNLNNNIYNQQNMSNHLQQQSFNQMNNFNNINNNNLNNFSGVNNLNNINNINYPYNSLNQLNQLNQPPYNNMTMNNMNNINNPLYNNMYLPNNNTGSFNYSLGNYPSISNPNLMNSMNPYYNNYNMNSFMTNQPGSMINPQYLNPMYNQIQNPSQYNTNLQSNINNSVPNMLSTQNNLGINQFTNINALDVPKNSNDSLKQNSNIGSSLTDTSKINNKVNKNSGNINNNSKNSKKNNNANIDNSKSQVKFVETKPRKSFDSNLQVNIINDKESFISLNSLYSKDSKSRMRNSNDSSNQILGSLVSRYNDDNNRNDGENLLSNEQLKPKTQIRYDPDKPMNSFIDKSINYIQTFLYNTLGTFLCTHKGSKEIQKKIPHYNREIANYLLICLLDENSIQKVIIDPYANYIFQKAVEVSSNEVRTKIICSLDNNFVSLATNVCGSHSIQCLVTLPGKSSEEISAIVDLLVKYTTETSTDQNSLHIILKAISSIEEAERTKLNERIIELSLKLVYDPFGVCVIKKFFVESVNYRDILLDKLKFNYIDIIQSPYGNYFIQTIMESASPEARESVVKEIISDILSICNEKFSFNCVIKLLEFTSKAEKKKAIIKLLNPEKLLNIKRNKYLINVINKMTNYMSKNFLKNLSETFGRYPKLQTITNLFLTKLSSLDSSK